MGLKMKITEIEIFKGSIKLKEPFRIAIAEIPSAKSIFVKIKTDQGLYGIGEANPIWSITGETQEIAFAAAVDLARFLIGKNPLQIEARLSELDAFLVHNSTIKSAFDMALHDLLGKTVELPLYELLGGEKRIIYTDMTVGIADPDYMAEKALQYKKAGFGIIKVKLGTEADKDILRIAKIRKAIGKNVKLRIDANQGWNFPEALKVLKALEPFEIEFCEQPVPHWNFQDMKRLREKVSIPIMADESLFDHHDALRLAAEGCCDYFNVKLAKSGGINKALKIIAIAEAAGIDCMLGSMTETRLGLTAAAHLAAARPIVKFVDLDGYYMLGEDPVTGGTTYNAGEIKLPNEPGLGADIDPAFLKNCESVVVR